MQTIFAGDDPPDPDQAIRDAATERHGKPLKIRIQPMILRAKANGIGGQYEGWREVCWTLECDSPSEAFETRDALRAFFDVLGRLGPAAVRGALQAVQAVEKQRRPSAAK